MKKVLTVLCLSLMSATGIADHHAPSIGGIETYACNYNEGNGLDDVLSAAKKWNKFAGKNFSMPYQGYVLTPYYRNAQDQQHDFYWIGVSPSFEAQGTTQDEMLAKGARFQAAFDEVSNCDGQAQWAMMPVKTSEGGPSAEGAVSFEACTMLEGATLAKMMAADVKMNAFMSKEGVTGNMMRWFPLSGQSSSFTADFYQVTGNNSLTERGKNFDRAVKSGGLQLRNALYGELVKCRGTGTSLYVSVGGKQG